MDWVTYEQMPWDRPHVGSIYSGLPEIVDDGVWRPIPSSTFRHCYYRVFDQRTFFVVCSHRKSRLLKEILAGEPPDSAEDAEWVLVRHDNGGYSVGSIFSSTFGPFLTMDEVNEWLSPCGLRLGEFEGAIRGFADFASLEPGCWLDAMERLRVLETLCLHANRKTHEFLGDLWGQYRSEFERASIGVPPEEIAPVPAAIRRSGPKHRTPVPDEESNSAGG